MTNTRSETVYDSIIIGGGPAGLSAAIYLGRFLRRPLVLDHGMGRCNYAQLNENYLGFPNGIKITDLVKKGRKQAERFGAEFVDELAIVVRNIGDGQFQVETPSGSYTGRTILFANGVTDIWPAIPGIDEYVGRSLFWCITCDGFRTQEQRLALFGNTDEAATSALQFLTFTDRIVFITTPGQEEISAEKLDAMAENGIEVVCDRVTKLNGARGKVRNVELSSGRKVEVEMMFSLLGQVPNSQLAASLGVTVNEAGYIITDEDSRTNVPGIYAAGDITNKHSHQVVAAAHEGAEAGEEANYYLYPNFQRVRPNDR